uniref:Uncharacterized protein n=1 Tax=Rhizophora mucronata TaxID=61149 RepID=A0A2P2N9R7_RHIMU
MLLHWVSVPVLPVLCYISILTLIESAFADNPLSNVRMC